jgi:hypothetical protein
MRFWVRNFACAFAKLRLCSATSPVIRLCAALIGDSASPAAQAQTFHLRGAVNDSREAAIRAPPRFFYASRSAAARGRRDRAATPGRYIGSE